MNHQFYYKESRAKRNGTDQPRALAAYHPLPDGVAANEALAAAASPWLNEYLAFAQKWSPRSCPGFHEACGVWLLSAIAARRVRFDFGGPSYTSLYLALVGESGWSAKTSASRIALEIFEQLGLNGLFLADRFPPEEFLWVLNYAHTRPYNRLDEAEQARARLRLGFAGQRAWYYHMFDVHLPGMGVEDTPLAALRIMVTELADSPEEYIGPLAEDESGTERPYLAILTELTPVALREVAAPGSVLWENGLLGSFMLATPLTDEIRMGRFPREEWALSDSIVEPLRAWHERLGLPQVREVQPRPGGPISLERLAPAPVTTVEIADEVRRALLAYDETLWGMALHFQTKDLHTSYRNLPERALRVAVLLASLEHEGEDDRRVESRHWARAQQIAEGWRASVHRLYAKLGGE